MEYKTKCRVLLAVIVLFWLGVTAGMAYLGTQYENTKNKAATRP